jgi:hypothetical protein
LTRARQFEEKLALYASSSGLEGRGAGILSAYTGKNIQVNQVNMDKRLRVGARTLFAHHFATAFTTAIAATRA